MTFLLEYPIEVIRSTKRPVQRSISVPLFGIFLLLASSGFAQHESASSGGSSSSSHSSGVSASSATFSHGTPYSGGITTTHTSHSPSGAGHSGNGGHRTHQGSSSGEVAYYPYYYAVPFPYALDATEPASSGQDQAEDDDAEYQGGPTVFDRRGSGAASYVPPTYEGPAHGEANAAAEAADSNSNPETQQPLTALVFKDGRLLEIENYAIVSQTLYDLTPGHPRKIALADLDLPATEKQNDDRGVTFQLPPPAQAN